MPAMAFALPEERYAFAYGRRRAARQNKLFRITQRYQAVDDLKVIDGASDPNQRSVTVLYACVSCEGVLYRART